MADTSTRPKDRKSKSDRNLELREAASRRRDMIVHSACGLPFFLVEKLLPVIWISAIGYFVIYLPLTEISGKKTEFWFQVLADLSANDAFYWLTIVILGGGNFLQHTKHRRYIKRHGQREKELEGYLDSNRGSSGLDVNGEPPSQDDD